MKKIKFLLIPLLSFPALIFAADQIQNQQFVNRMMVVKSAKPVGEEGLKVLTDKGTYSANVYHIGVKGYDLILKSKKDKLPICFNDVTKNSDKKNHWFFEDVQPTCNQ